MFFHLHTMGEYASACAVCVCVHGEHMHAPTLVCVPHLCVMVHVLRVYLQTVKTTVLMLNGVSFVVL